LTKTKIHIFVKDVNILRFANNAIIGDRMKDKNEVERIYERLERLATMYAELNKKRKAGIQPTDEEFLNLNKVATSLRYYTNVYKEVIEGKNLKINPIGQPDPSKYIIGSDGWVLDSIPPELNLPIIDNESIIGKEIKILNIITIPSSYPEIQGFYAKAIIEYNGEKFQMNITPQVYKRIRDIKVLPIVIVINKRTSKKSGYDYYFAERHKVLPESHPVNLPEPPKQKEESKSK